MTEPLKKFKLKVAEDPGEDPCKCGRRSTVGVHGCNGATGAYSFYYCDICWSKNRHNRRKPTASMLDDVQSKENIVE